MTTKPNAMPHLQRMPPKPLKKGGLHSIHESSPLNGQQKAFTTHDPAVRARAFDAQVRGMQPPIVTPVRNSTQAGVYTGAELQPTAARPGANDGLALPSRVGHRLTYRDGRVEQVS